MSGWDTVIGPLLDIAEGDATLTGLVAAADMVKADERDLDPDTFVSALEWTLIADSLGEVKSDVILQIDLIFRNFDDQVLAERRLVELWHDDVGQTLGGVRMDVTYEGGNALQGSRDGMGGRSLQWRINPIRNQYTT